MARSAWTVTKRPFLPTSCVSHRLSADDWHIPEAVLQKVPSDRELSRLASRLGPEWESVLLDLGLSAEALFRCRADHSLSTHGQVLAGLVHWRRSLGKEATVQQLLQSLQAADIHPSILEEVFQWQIAFPSFAAPSSSFREMYPPLFLTFQICHGSVRLKIISHFSKCVNCPFKWIMPLVLLDLPVDMAIINVSDPLPPGHKHLVNTRWSHDILLTFQGAWMQHESEWLLPASGSSWTLIYCTLHQMSFADLILINQSSFYNISSLISELMRHKWLSWTAETANVKTSADAFIFLLQNTR